MFYNIYFSVENARDTTWESCAIFIKKNYYKEKLSFIKNNEKTIKASVIGLTKSKKCILDNDYFNYQWWMIFGKDNGLLSCFKAFKNYK